VETLLCIEANHHIKATLLALSIFRAVMLLCCCLSVAAFICVFAFHGASAKFNPDSQRGEAIPQYCPKGVTICITPPLIEYQYPGFFDQETWFCQIGAFPRFINWPFVSTSDLSQYRRTCVLETAARWTSIFPVVLTMALCFLYHVDWRGERVLIRTWKDHEHDMELWDDEE
jgi:hypothetical protein